MTVPSWRNRPKSSLKVDDRSARARNRAWKSNRSAVEQLETRQLLTFSSTLTGSTSTFTVGSSTDSIVFSQSGGLLQHNTLTAPSGQGFADNFDFDSSVAGSQHLAISAASTVDVQGTAYNATIGTPTSSASGLLAAFNLAGNAGSSATIDDSGNTASTTYSATSGALTATGINVGLTGSAFGGVGLDTGSGDETVNVRGDSSPLTLIPSGGANSINVGNAGSLAAIAQPLAIVFGPQVGANAITVDDSADTANKQSTLSSTGSAQGAISLTGLAPSSITFPFNSGVTLSVLGGKGTDTQTVDFSAGDPFPENFTYQGGSGSNTLILQGTLPGGENPNEDVNATGPGAGNIAIIGQTIDFTGLKPVVDTFAAGVYTFNYTGGLDARISVGSGATVNGQETTLISSSSAIPQFEQVSYANKANVVINTGNADDLVSVIGSALLPGSSTTIDGQNGTNTLNYDAGGSIVDIAPNGLPGQATITRAGSGTLLVANFSQINVVNGQIQGVLSNPPTVGTTASLRGTDGVPLTNADLATFTAAFPTATAADFGATINWGDGTFTAGTVVPDASNPTLDHVEGSHTYTSPGNFSIGVSVSERQANLSILPGVTLTQLNVASVSNSASIADAPLSASGTTLVAVAGQPLAQALVASFTYAGGLVPLTNFTGTISWGDGTSSTFGSTNLATSGTSAAGTTYLVTASHTYPGFGTFPVAVTINSSGGSSAVAPGSAVVTDSPFTFGLPGSITAREGTPFIGTVATFTDLGGSLANYQALITWGDGHVTQGTVIPDVAANTFTVSGSNEYAKAGLYSATVSVRDTSINGGSTATIAVQVGVLGAAISQAPGTFINVDTVFQPFTDLVAAFTSGNVFASASDFAATINWGDGTPPTAGTILQNTNGTFAVSGSHTYFVPAPITNPYPVTVAVKELAPISSAAATLIGGQSVVNDALLTAQGTTVTGVEGSPTLGTLIASFTYAGSFLPTSNFRGTVAWGDGTSSALTASNFTIVPAGSGPPTYLVNDAHTFATQGTFPIVVTVDSAYGGSAVAQSTAIVSDALAVSILPPAPVEGLAFASLAVATFRDAGTPDPASKYSATINYGDGSAIIPGTIVANPDGSFNVLSSHQYANPGSFPLTVTVTNDLSGETSATANVTITPAALAVVGHLNPASDSGESHTDAITNNARPNFYGTATPGTIVSLVAIPVGSTTPIPIGSTVTDASGAWSVTSVTLPDGRYTIEATGTDASGITRVLDVILPNPLQGPLVIDTAGPKVESVLFDPLRGQILVTLQDNRSGLDRAMVLNGANYSFVRVAALSTQAHLKKGSVLLPTSFVVTGLSATAPGDPSAPENVVVTLNHGNPIRGGYYRVTITSGGIQDVAGNALDGEFYGYFPSGNNLPGGAFVANLDSVHNTVFAPSPVGSSASPLSPPGTLPTATTIPTIGKFVVIHGKATAILADAPHSSSKLKPKTARIATTHGKPTPHAGVAARPRASAIKSSHHHG